LPMWEDSNNCKGGKWTYNEKRDKGMSSSCVDKLWVYSMMSLVGETYPDSDQICGAVCSLRQKQDRVAVWTKDANVRDYVTHIHTHTHSHTHTHTHTHTRACLAQGHCCTCPSLNPA